MRTKGNPDLVPRGFRYPRPEVGNGDLVTVPDRWSRVTRASGNEIEGTEAQTFICACLAGQQRPETKDKDEMELVATTLDAFTC